MDLKPAAFALPVLALLLIFCPHTIHAATYYVDSVDGKDSSSGVTRDRAWKSLEKVNGSGFLPGDTILFKRGGVWHGCLLITASGTDDKPIVYGAFGDSSKKRPVISGFADTALKWSRAGKTLYRARVDFPDNNPALLIYQHVSRPPTSSYVFEQAHALPEKGSVLLQTDGTYRAMWVRSSKDDILSGYVQRPLVPGINVHVRSTVAGKEKTLTEGLPPPRPVFSPQALEEPGDWSYDRDSKTVFLCSAIPPVEADIKISKEHHGIRLVSCSNVCIRNLHVEGFSETGIYIHEADRIKISDTNVEQIGVAGHRTGILLFNSRDCQISSCTVKSALGNGIALYACDYIGNAKGTYGNLVTGCRVERTGAAGISLSTDSEKTAGLMHDNIIEKNRISGANSFFYDAAGIYLLFTRGNIIRENSVMKCGTARLRSSGIMLDTGTRAVAVVQNAIFANSLCGIAITGNGHTVTRNKIAENGTSTFDAAQVVIFPALRDAQGCRITLNMLSARRGQRLVMYAAQRNSHGENFFDFNSYLAAQQDAFCFSTSASCNAWTDFATWQKKTGQDIHSTFSIGQISNPVLKP